MGDSIRCAHLDDLPNLATSLTYKQLASSIFVAESNSLSKLEVYATKRTPDLPTSREQHSQTSRTDEPTDGSISVEVQKSNGSALQNVAVDEILPGTVVLKSVQELEKYIKTSRRPCAYFIRKRNSYSSLSISQLLFEHLCEEIGIPVQFRDYLVYFGKREHEVEIAPPPFSLGIPDLSAQNEPARWQMMGIIRFMETNSRTDVSKPSLKWSIRQTAMFCTFSIDGTRQCWVFVSISGSAETLLKSVWESETQSASSPFDTLYALYHFAVCNWRPYMVALAREIEQHEEDQLGTAPDNTGPVPLAGPEERQALLILEKKILEARLAIQSTKADLQALQSTLQRRHSSTQGTSVDHDSWLGKLDICLRDLDTNFMRIEQLHARLQGITNLVSSFLDLSSGHALHVLTQQSQDENKAMRKLNEKMADLAKKNADEAITVTVLAVLTLIYLPLTVVSNFFSTSFVGMGPSSEHIFITKDWWILFVVAVPLTGLTFYIWWIWSEIKARKNYPFWWTLVGLKKPKRKTTSSEEIGDHSDVFMPGLSMRLEN